MRGVIGVKKGQLVALYTKKRHLGKYRCLEAHFFREKRMVAVRAALRADPDPVVLDGMLDFALTSRDALLPLRDHLMGYLTSTYDEFAPPDPLREEAAAAIVAMDTRVLYYSDQFLASLRSSAPIPIGYNAALLSEVVENTLRVLQKVKSADTPLQNLHVQ